MKKKYSTPNLIKVVSLSTVMATLLSSVSPVFAANLSITGETVRSTNGGNVMYPHGSHGSVVLSGDDDYCGVDNVIDRGGKQQQGIADSQRITAQEQYDRFVGEKVFGNRSPYGTTTGKVIWAGDGYTTSTDGRVLGGYMGGITGGFMNALPEAYGVYSFATGCGSAATGNYSTVFGAGATAKAGGAQAFGVSALASGIASVAMGVGSEASGKSAVAIGGLATASGKNSVSIGVRSQATLDDAIAFGSDATASGINSVAIGKVASASGYDSIALGLKTKAADEYAVAIGTKAEAQALGSIAIGGGEPAESGEERKVIAKGKNSIAIGTHTYAETAHSVAIGINAQVRVIDGVAVGGGSVSRVNGEVLGYDPVTNTTTTKNDLAWKSTAGDFSVGNTNQKLTRQITNVAAGSEDTDAVNVAQLKAMRDVIAGGGTWQISANDTDPTDVNSDNTVDFSVKNGVVGKDNLKIAKKTEGTKHKIEFTLSDMLKLTSVTTGRSSMSDDGFIITNGAKITIDGIDAGNKQITKVADATADDEAVNYKQLKEVKDGFKTSWQLSVNGADATHIGPNGVVNLQSAGRESNPNIKITKNGDNTVEFGLSDDINVMTVTAGESVMDAAGFRFNNGEGPSITVKGIHAGGKTIKGVANAEDDTDAVNFSQLKKIEGMISEAGGWKLSVNSGDATDVKAGSIVDFVGVNAEDGNEESKNIKITKNGDNTVKFDLNDIVRVKRVIAGKANLSDNGFVITGGPNMTTGGIYAGNKKITGVADGADEHDAVNYSQLNEIKNEIAGNSLVKWDEGKKFITIGKEKDGTTIDITGSEGDRTISGVKAAVEDNDAVNKKQLEETIRETAESIKLNILVKQDGENAPITVGKERGGTTINIANKSGDARIISGVKAAVNPDEAVNKEQLDGQIADITDIVNNIKIDSAFAVRYDKNEDGSINYNSVTLGGDKSDGSVALLNVKDGKIAKNSHDAINGSQINEISQDVAKFFGGDAAFEDGAFKGPKYSLSVIFEDGTIGNINYRDVGSALKGLDGNVKSVNNRLTNVTNEFTQRFDTLSQDALLWSEEEQAFVARHGGEGNKTKSKISYLMNGEIHEESTDAINGSQINKISGDIASFFGGGTSFENGVFVGPQYNLSTVSADGKVEQKIFENVGDALTGIDANVKNVNSRLTYVDNKFDKFSQDALLWDEGKKAFVALHEKNGEKTESKLTYLLNGDITEDSTDAINGSQVHSMGSEIATYFGGNASFTNGVFRKPRYNLTTIDENGQEKQTEHNDVGSALSGLNMNIRHVNQHLLYAINDVAKYFGGGAGYDENREWHAPTFKVYQINDNGTVSKKPYDNVAEAFEGVNNTFTNIHNQISDITKNSLVKQEEENGLITVGKETGGTKISIVNKGGMERILSGVKDGTISETSKEAVNGSQLFKVSQNTSKYFGGSTDVFAGIEPTFLIQGETHHNVFDAFTAVNTSITNIDNKISDVVKNSLVKQDGVSAPITIGKDTAGTEINIAGYGKVARSISGVKAAEKGDEAVNKDQLDKSIKDITKDIETASAAAVLYDKNDDGNVNYGSVTLGGDKNNGPVALLNVKDGRIAANSTDAITGNQLYLMSNQLAAYFGGGAKYENGKWTNPTFKIVQVNANGTTVEKEHHNVADAFGDINDGMSNINNRIDDVINKVDSDALKWNDKEKAYDANRDGKPNKIINVADGKIVKGSKDAVNGGQLWETNERVTGVEKDVKHLTNRVDNISNTIADIGDVVLNIDTKVDNINNRVDGIEEDAVRYDRDENGKKTNKITLAGADASEPVMIDNVADGKIEKGSKEAVNGSQLHDYTKEQMKIILDESKHYTDQRVNNIVIDAIDDAVDQSKQYTDMKFNVLNYSIESVKKEARQAAAIGLAVSNLRYNDTPGKLSVGFGTGLWRSQSAFAFGAGYTSENGKYRSNISATTSGGHWGVGAGFNMTLN
ncbi:Vomp family autotransporter [Bartonella sp. TT119HLJHH]|uniref:Vomp family autotransporter n=1 Tax=Bartonella sp. TT119HLJHH TaxID=3243579 RepID=UPI0035D053E5